MLLALTLAAYALAMTMGRGSFGPGNLALLSTALLGGVIFVVAEARAASPLLRPAMFRDPTLSAGLAMSVLVSTVMMATLVVGPFYLSRALGLDAARVGLVMSAGPLVAALIGVPAGRIVDRFGSQRMTTVGLVGMAAGLLALSRRRGGSASPATSRPSSWSRPNYALFQAANNTDRHDGCPTRPAGRHCRDAQSVAQSRAHHRRVAMGAVFAFASAATDITTAHPEAVAAGMRATFSVAALLIVVALAGAMASHALAKRPSRMEEASAYLPTA